MGPSSRPAALVVTPLYLIIARRAGADSGAIVASLWPPVVAGILAALVGHVVAGEVDSEPVAVLVGVLAVLASYALLLGWWVVPRARGLWRSRAAPLPAPGAADSPSPHRPDDPSPRPDTRSAHREHTGPEVNGLDRSVQRIRHTLRLLRNDGASEVALRLVRRVYLRSGASALDFGLLSDDVTDSTRVTGSLGLGRRTG